MEAALSLAALALSVQQVAQVHQRNAHGPFVLGFMMDDEGLSVAGFRSLNVTQHAVNNAQARQHDALHALKSIGPGEGKSFFQCLARTGAIT